MDGFTYADGFISDRDASFNRSFFADSTASTERRSLAVRIGTTQTLSCANVKQDEADCEGVTGGLAQETRGRRCLNTGGVSDRLRVTERCSLVAEEVTGSTPADGPVDQNMNGEKTRWFSTKPSGKSSELDPTTEKRPPEPPGGRSWWNVSAAVGGTGLLVTVVAVVIVRWKRTKGPSVSCEPHQDSGIRRTCTLTLEGSILHAPVYINANSGPVTSSAKAVWMEELKLRTFLLRWMTFMMLVFVSTTSLLLLFSMT